MSNHSKGEAEKAKAKGFPKATKNITPQGSYEKGFTRTGQAEAETNGCRIQNFCRGVKGIIRKEKNLTQAPVKDWYGLAITDNAEDPGSFVRRKLVQRDVD